MSFIKSYPCREGLFTVLVHVFELMCRTVVNYILYSNIILCSFQAVFYSNNSHLGWQQYMDHYWRDTPSLLIQTSHTLSFKMESVAMGDNRIMLYMRTMPPSIFQTIYSIFQGRKVGCNHIYVLNFWKFSLSLILYWVWSVKEQNKYSK